MFFLFLPGDPAREPAPLHLLHRLFALRLRGLFQQLQDDFPGHLPPVPAPDGQLPEEDLHQHHSPGPAAVAAGTGDQLQDLHGGVPHESSQQDPWLRLPLLRTGKEPTF